MRKLKGPNSHWMLSISGKFTIMMRIIYAFRYKPTNFFAASRSVSSSLAKQKRMTR